MRSAFLLSLGFCLPAHGWCPSWGQCRSDGSWARSKPNPVLGTLNEHTRFDAYHRRITPVPSVPKRRFIALFGGSNMYGAWLKDQETIGANLGRRFTDHGVYNYAFPGTGPAHAVDQMRAANLSAQIPEPHGVGIYLYFSFHLFRNYPNVHFVGYTEGAAPYYRLKGNRLIREGTMGSALPLVTRLFTFLGSKYRRWVFPSPGKYHERLQCEMFRDMSSRFQSAFPGSDFVVATYYYKGQRDSLIPDCLLPHDIHFEDITLAMHERWRKDFSVPADGHLSAPGARAVAEVLSPVVTASDRELDTPPRIR